MQIRKLVFARTFTTLTVMLAMLAQPRISGAAPKGPDPYYTQRPLFLPAPDSRSARWKVPHFGPVGIGIDLVKPNFTMLITRVDKDSPADKTGKLRTGQIIESVNGEVLKDRDPREILGDWITQAEATDGKLVLKIKDVGDVLVQIPVLGSYSPTWPVNCPKSDKIVRNLADLIAKEGQNRWGSIMFLLSTGEEKDLDVVRKWIKEAKSIGPYPWHKGYVGVEFCEYYLRTGDPTVLPLIQQGVEELKGFMYNDAWSGRGTASYSYGHLNAAGVHCVTFVLMAKLCGVEVEDQMLQSSLRHFYRFAGHGNAAYGDSFPEGGFRDNGKTGGLAVAMAAAALLTPNGEQSVYADARDNSAMKSFYATTWFHSAHTGGGIGEIWHNACVSMLADKRPIPYRSYIDTRRWVMELSRRHDGGIGIGGLADRYDKSVTEDKIAWGNYFALTYTIPCKTLQLYGAPRSPYAKSFALPERPWGNASDDAFQSPEPASHPSISMQDLLNERVETDASARIWSKWGKDPSDAMLLKYLHHPEFEYRRMIMNKVIGSKRNDIIMDMLKSPDARLRYNGLIALTGFYKGSQLSEKDVTPEMLAEVEKMLTSPTEAWWNRISAMEALKRGGAPLVAKHKALLLKYLTIDDWWFQSAALEALMLIATDPEHYQDVLPPIAELLGKTRRARILQFSRDLIKLLPKAKPDVQNLAVNVFRDAFVAVPQQFADGYTGYIPPGGANRARKYISSIITPLPGGAEIGRTDPKMTLKWRNTGNDTDLYVYSGTFTPNPKFIGKWLEQIEIDTLSNIATIPERVRKEEQRRINIAKQIKEKLARRATNPNAKKGKGGGTLGRKIAKTYLELKDGGQVGGSKLLFWSEDMLIDNGLGEARQMLIKEIDGTQYLLVEKGGFVEEENTSTEDEEDEETNTDDENTENQDSYEEQQAKPWHCGYIVYEHVK
jgi:hypothetical protein